MTAAFGIEITAEAVVTHADGTTNDDVNVADTTEES